MANCSKLSNLEIELCMWACLFLRQGSWSLNVFVQIKKLFVQNAKFICANQKHLFVQIVKCVCANQKIYLCKLQNVFLAKGGVSRPPPTVTTTFSCLWTSFALNLLHLSSPPPPPTQLTTFLKFSLAKHICTIVQG